MGIYIMYIASSIITNHKDHYNYIGLAETRRFTVYKICFEDEDNLPCIGLLCRGDGKYFSCIIRLDHRGKAATL